VIEKIIEQVFSNQGNLKTIIENFEERNEQNQMAQAVYLSLKNKRHLLVEAGTGVGKTLAYLLPSVLWLKENNKKVIVSTYTKILQNQIINKDIPILKEILRGACPERDSSVASLSQNDNKRRAQNDKSEELNCAVIFGQENYVCKRRMASAFSYGLFDTAYEFSELDAFQRWLSDGGSGIIPEYPQGLGRGQEKVCRDGDICKFQKCQYYNECYYFQERNKWLKADLLVTNHFLFFANVETGYMILPKFDAIIFDEAHRLEEVASHYFGIEVSNFGLHRLLNSVYNPSGRSGILAHIEIPDSQKRDIAKILNEARDMGDEIFNQLQTLIPKHESRIRVKRPPNIENSLDKVFSSLLNALLAIEPDKLEDDIELELKSKLKRLEAYRNSITHFLEVDDKNSVYWIEANIASQRKTPLVYLSSALIDISQLFQKRVTEKIPSIILTSATLTVSKDFNFIKNRLGLGHAETLLLSSPFNYHEQALLCVPTNLPLPNDEDRFYPSIASVIDNILTFTQGRALVLFTSFDSLQKTYDLVDKTKFPIFLQGQESTFELLDKFKNDISSVLFATQSFWQGIDVPGEALSCLIIVRLPFDVPDDPRLEGICEKLRENDIEPFSAYQLPNAVLRFRQGFGRLIRNKLDRGVVCVLDKRIVTKDYGKSFIYSLPKNLPMAFSIEAIKDFFDTE
jgi:ATP-dependent DNA helicase DinG